MRYVRLCARREQQFRFALIEPTDFNAPRGLRNANFDSGGSACPQDDGKCLAEGADIRRQSRIPSGNALRTTAFHLDALPAVAHAPDGLVAVFADKQAAVFRDGDSDRATPDFAFGRDEAGHEVFVFAARFAG